MVLDFSNISSRPFWSTHYSVCTHSFHPNQPVHRPVPAKSGPKELRGTGGATPTNSTSSPNYALGIVAFAILGTWAFRHLQRSLAEANSASCPRTGCGGPRLPFALVFPQGRLLAPPPRSSLDQPLDVLPPRPLPAGHRAQSLPRRGLGPLREPLFGLLGGSR